MPAESCFCLGSFSVQGRGRVSQTRFRAAAGLGGLDAAVEPLGMEGQALRVPQLTHGSVPPRGQTVQLVLNTASVLFLLPRALLVC